MGSGMVTRVIMALLQFKMFSIIMVKRAIKKVRKKVRLAAKLCSDFALDIDLSTGRGTTFTMGQSMLFFSKDCLNFMMFVL